MCGVATRQVFEHVVYSIYYIDQPTDELAGYEKVHKQVSIVGRYILCYSKLAASLFVGRLKERKIVEKDS